MHLFKSILSVCFITFCFTGQVFAGDLYGGLGLGLSSSRISTWDDDETDTAFKLYGGYSFTRNLSIEAGYFIFDDFKTDPEMDSISEYSLTFARDDLYLAPTFQFKPKYFIPVRLMAGVTYSKVKMTVEESFYGLSSQGSASVEDEVMGLYLSLGVMPFDFRHVGSVVSIEYLYRPDVFGMSERSFDFEEIMIQFSIFFR